jgi:hypothetical protein
MQQDKTRVLNVRVPEDLFLEVRSLAGRADKTNAQVVTEALRRLLGQQLPASGINPQPTLSNG